MAIATQFFRLAGRPILPAFSTRQFTHCFKTSTSSPSMCPNHDKCKRLKSCKEIDLCQIKRELDNRKAEDHSKNVANPKLSPQLVQLKNSIESPHSHLA